MIVLGLFTPAAGAAAAGAMIPAAAVLSPKGFFATSGGYEYPALLGLSATALALTGPWRLVARCPGWGHVGLEPDVDGGRHPAHIRRGLRAGSAASSQGADGAGAPCPPRQAGRNGHLPDGATTPSPAMNQPGPAILRPRGPDRGSPDRSGDPQCHAAVASPGNWSGCRLEFLLEREPAAWILCEFSLAVVSQYFPGYPAEIRARLGSSHPGPPR